MVFPRWAADVALAVVVKIARRPLRFEIPFTGMTHQCAIARCRHREPVSEMAAVARAPRDLFRRIEEPETLDRRVRCFVQLVRRAFEWIELNVLRELLAVSGRAG